MPEAPERKQASLEKKIEAKVEEKIEKDVEKKVEQKIEKQAEKRIEQKVEKKFGKEISEIKAELEAEKEFVAKSPISIHVDSYDFIFDDFDPRPFSQRALSDDFLREAKKFALEVKPGVLELNFLIHESIRKQEIEATIKKRLHEHFRKSLAESKKEHDWIVKKGSIMVLAGFAMTLGAAAIGYYFGEASFLFVLIFVILEPAGWFTFWTGLDQLFYEARKTRPNLEFYAQMSKAEINFQSY
ncbi:MAG TPA: hypothetical protein HA222_01565 [Candidatus Diapherotrites archaeon]|uniref:Uncharacterized protein n=1 Tax=Candidatus Iainarchaeum sp. TaxID=3101447 RepID=A0A7J4JU71_9ARCH|nr:hypothetical protein [Candidatus Diapherotrites archaeon]